MQEEDQVDAPAHARTPGLRLVLWCGFVGAVALTGWVFVQPLVSEAKPHGAQLQTQQSAPSDDPSALLPMPLI